MGFMDSLKGAFSGNSGDWFGSLLDSGGDIGGALINSNATSSANSQNADLQREFAKNGIRWKVEDAKRAGIHPLAALGAQTISPSASFTADTSLGDSFSRMGQNISRSVNATRTSDERKLATLQLQSQQAQLDGQIIDNQIRATQLRQMNQVGPAMPSTVDGMSGLTGQGDATGLLPPPVQVNSNPIIRADPDNPSKEAGSVTDYGVARTAGGGLAIVPSSDVKQRIEDTFWPELSWSLRNTHIFSEPPTPNPRNYPLPRGASKWKWNPILQEFQPFYPGKKYSRFHYFNWVK